MLPLCLLLSNSRVILIGGQHSIMVFISLVNCAADREAESALLARVEAKHSTFPTYVHGMSKAGSPVIYKPSLSGLRDFRRLFVLQTDSYLIDTWLEVRTTHRLDVLVGAF